MLSYLHEDLLYHRTDMEHDTGKEKEAFFPFLKEKKSLSWLQR